jgi:hypothetical protein
MNTDLVRPCAHCPFRKDIPAYLTAERAEEICHSLLEEDKSFSCHETNQFNDDGETVETSESQHCAGAMILLEKLERPNQWMRIMERLRLYDHTKLDMKAPVFDSVEEMQRELEAAAIRAMEQPK